MFGQKKWLVIIVSASTLQIVEEGSSKVETIPLPETIVSNMEVINKDNLYVLLTDWVKQRPFASTEIIWLLADDLCFAHPLTSHEQDKLDSEKLQFLDSVPFEEVLTHEYPLAGATQLVAVNQSLIMALIQGFSLHGYSTSAVVPSFLLTPSPTLTVELAHLADKRLNELAKESLVPLTSLVRPAFATPKTAEPGSTPAKPKSQLPLLLSIFGVLLAILGIVLYLYQ